ncbi:MAG: hypothetical protein CMJ81_17235 [Planctomycetaceae bacterium]|nr:hypothetical protein [Planctomycetaceae bacterium]
MSRFRDSFAGNWKGFNLKSNGDRPNVNLSNQSTRANDGSEGASISEPFEEGRHTEGVLIHGGSRTKSERQLHHGLILLSGIVVLTLAASLRVRGDREVVVPVWNKPLPSFCLVRRLFGLDCPGCGLTRSFICLAHGEIVTACRHNPAAAWLFSLVVLQIPLRTLQIWKIHHGLQEWNSTFRPWFVWPFLAILIGQWSIKFVNSWLILGVPMQ